MASKEVLRILHGLLQKAKASKVNWTAGSDMGEPSSQDDYYVVFPNSSINIYRDSEGKPRANVINGRGQIVFQVVPVANEETFLLNELLQLAQRQYVKTDETIAEIEAALSTKDMIGEIGKSPPQYSDEDIPF